MTQYRMAAVVLLATAVAAAGAQDDPRNAHVWEPRVRSVSVFKNGFGFFMAEGDAALRDGWCVADAVPPATFGTFALFSHEEGETVDIVGSGPGELMRFDDVDLPSDTESKRRRLEACRYLKLEVSYVQQGAARTAVGRLDAVGDAFLVLEAEGNNLAVPLHGVTAAQVLEKPLRLHVTGKRGGNVERTTLGMAYLRKGITWIPEYTLELIDDTTAELTLRGTLVNEAEDLVHCDVNFVVGVPHFLHTEYLAPVAVGQVIRTIGAAVAPRQVMTQIMNRAAVATDTSRAQPTVHERPVTSNGRALDEVTGNLPSWQGTGGSDFTVFTRKDLTLRRGEKAIVTLFVKRIRYGHIYRWDPPGDVRHLLTLENTTGTSWTTGPCLALSDGQALGEDLLEYVPEGGRGEFPVTHAINIAHHEEEEELARKFKVHQPSHNYYLDLVTLGGKLTLHNYTKDTVEIVCRKTITGEPLEASDGGTMRQDTAKLKLVERSGTITWRLTIKPGRARTLSYSYQRYVPSR